MVPTIATVGTIKGVTMKGLRTACQKAGRQRFGITVVGFSLLLAVV